MVEIGKIVYEEVAESEIASDLGDGNSSPTDNFEAPQPDVEFDDSIQEYSKEIEGQVFDNFSTGLSKVSQCYPIRLMT
ncbi:hypothetical protein RND71_001621 [Anisodus tanguticus]|uniref:Uncharacterized protein n=1 Tax=Anisodus tanguticus TaxID=243964 RepID=A0AAE1T187_9SOLA|nr:hypothetical protein RND71_001621 [Anisodus tanguticus]